MATGNGVFDKAGFVAGNGTTSSTTSYDFTVPNLKAGTYNFRLKIIDLDGSFTYSPVRSLKVTNVLDVAINVYPNPVKDGYAYIEILNTESKDAKVTITNALGQIVKTAFYKSLASPIKIQMPAAKGEYYIQVTAGDDKPVVKKVIKL